MPYGENNKPQYFPDATSEPLITAAAADLECGGMTPVFFLRGDMSPRFKAQTCLSTPKRLMPQQKKSGFLGFFPTLLLPFPGGDADLNAL